MLRVKAGNQMFSVNKVVLLEGYKQIPLNITDFDNSSIVELPSEVPVYPDIMKIREFIENGKFVLVDKIHLFWLFSSKELIEEYGKYSEKEEQELTSYGAYIRRKVITVVIGGIEFKGEEILEFKIVYPAELEKVEVLEVREYELLFNAIFKSSLGEFEKIGTINKMGQITWAYLPASYPCNELYTTIVQESPFMEQLIKTLIEGGQR